MSKSWSIDKNRTPKLASAVATEPAMTLAFCRRLFYFLVAGLLYLTALAKVLSAVAAKPELLALPDPVIENSERSVLLFASTADLAVAAVLVLSKNSLFKNYSLLWLSGCFLIYRFWWSVVSPPGHCKCLGELTDWIGVSPTTASFTLLGVSGGLFVASFLLITIRKPFAIE